MKERTSPYIEETLARMVAQYEVPLLRTCYMYLRDRALASSA